MFDDLPKFVFFTGKGGVGKTSLACATALSLVDKGRTVLLVSTDPASNVGQVFEAEIGNRLTAIPKVSGLDAMRSIPRKRQLNTASARRSHARGFAREGPQGHRGAALLRMYD